MSKSREQLNTWLKTIELKGGCLLDVGVQDKPVRDRLGGCDVDCYRTLDVDVQWNPDILMDLNEVDNNQVVVAKLYEHAFDYVFAIEVFEHLWNPIAALKQIYTMLNKDGYLYLSWPFINPLHDIFDACRYTEEGMRNMLERTGFEVVDVDYRRATVGKEHLEAFYQAEGIRVSKIRPPQDHVNKDVIGFMLIARKR